MPNAPPPMGVPAIEKRLLSVSMHIRYVRDGDREIGSWLSEGSVCSSRCGAFQITNPGVYTCPPAIVNDCARASEANSIAWIARHDNIDGILNGPDLESIKWWQTSPTVWMVRLITTSTHKCGKKRWRLRWLKKSKKAKSIKIFSQARGPLVFQPSKREEIMVWVCALGRTNHAVIFPPVQATRSSLAPIARVAASPKANYRAESHPAQPSLPCIGHANRVGWQDNRRGPLGGLGPRVTASSANAHCWCMFQTGLGFPLISQQVVQGCMTCRIRGMSRLKMDGFKRRVLFFYIFLRNGLQPHQVARATSNHRPHH